MNKQRNTAKQTQEQQLKNNLSFQLAKSNAIKIMKFCKELNKRKDPLIYPITNQLVRSSSSVFANLAEASATQSTKDRHFKMSIAKKELTETIGWLIYLEELDYIDSATYKELIKSYEYLNNIITKSLNTMKTRLNND